MILNEDNYIEIIDSYDIKHWQNLLDLIPEIESTKNFGEMAGGEKDDKGVIQMPYYVEAAVVMKFPKLVEQSGALISFDYTQWDDGWNITGNNEFDFDSIDIPTKCKLISAIIRIDRFSEGSLVDAFESGLILKILQSINRQLQKQ